ncbi:MAG: hypothetical protein JW828_11480 [Sedimentisphaerales bacterium]|nr:hypothetical protein [Sedimentisphaerales bacterium]
MKKRQIAKRTITLTAVISMAILSGCKKDVEPASPDASSPAVENSAAGAKTGAPSTEAAPAMTEALALWQKGKEDDAVALFVKTEWSKAALFAKDALLGMTEKEFIAIGLPERTQTHEKIMKELDVVRALCKSVIARAETFAVQEKPDTARQYFTAMSAFGKRIAEDPDALAILQVLGKSLQKKADQSLGDLN